jgi:ABC-type glycerol-3-phosphate transport system substrate-binding protein
MAVELAEFLTDGEYLARWCQAAGYIPPRSSALATGGNIAIQSLFSQIVFSARLYPAADTLANLSPPLQQAFLQVFKLQTDPAVAAQEAVNSLNEP